MSAILYSGSFLIDSAMGAYCPTLHADMLRRQEFEGFSSSGPFTVVNGTKHTPYITFSEISDTAIVTVGNGNETDGVFHPMVPSADPDEVHFVTHIWVLDQDENVIALDATDPNQAVPVTFTFAVPEGVTSMVAYEWCNLHGLWMGPEVTVPAEDTATERAAGDSCEVDELEEGAFSSTHADFLRQQSLFFNSSVAFTVDDGTKHTPYISLAEDKTSVTVEVGNGEVDGGVFHPMMAASADADPHWITHIYVVDQSGNIIGMKTLDPSDVDMAVTTFEISEGVTEVTAYEWCNLHGLWRGPTVRVVTDEDDSPASIVSWSKSSVLAAAAVSMFLL